LEVLVLLLSMGAVLVLLALLLILSPLLLLLILSLLLLLLLLWLLALSLSPVSSPKELLRNEGNFFPSNKIHGHSPPP
jgi:membrane protein implicated in regulation of membrane protease activity